MKFLSAFSLVVMDISVNYYCSNDRGNVMCSQIPCALHVSTKGNDRLSNIVYP